ncbi:MAG: asparaginase [Halobacteriovoraceae bacterium]|jgi:L-asparaginase|nr:asparaginase [Halobacteriovoraceae bacterium]
MINDIISQNKWFRINIITTGGTIEKTYDELEGRLYNRETVIKNRINQRLRLPYTEIIIHSVMSIDSLDMTNEQREVIGEMISSLAKEKHPIVVLHGTDTMQATAELAKKLHPQISVPVIFTGAMKPLGFEDSDALQNVTEALIAAQIIPADYYISFHNRLFKVPAVRKNKKIGTFESFSKNTLG